MTRFAWAVPGAGYRRTNIDVTNSGGGTVNTVCVHTADEALVAVNADCS